MDAALPGRAAGVAGGGEAEALGKTVWLVDRPVARARRMVLVSLDGTLAEIELRVQDAVELLSTLEEPADLVLCDPPWGLDRRSPDDLVNGQGRLYRRDQSRVVGGYVDVPGEVYREFVRGWVSAAAAALRPGGQLAVVTGPEKAAVHQMAAESAGLEWVQTIAARREFSLYARRRVSAAHWTITVMVNGPVGSRRRVFHPPADLPRSRAGGLYPTSVWLDNGRADRHQVMRYDNALPLRLVRRIVEMLTDPGAFIVDPAAGSGTTAIACWQSGRRCQAGDINRRAVIRSRAALGRALLAGGAPTGAVHRLSGRQPGRGRDASSASLPRTWQIAGPKRARFPDHRGRAVCRPPSATTSRDPRTQGPVDQEVYEAHRRSAACEA